MGSLSNLIPGIQATLAADSAIVALVGTSGAVPLVLQGTPQGLIEGTEAGALVVSHDGAWYSSNLQNSTWFPKVLVEVWIDPARDSDNVATESTAEVVNRALALYEEVDRLLHRPSGGDIEYGLVKVASSQRLVGPPKFYEVPDGTGLVRGDAYYALVVN